MNTVATYYGWAIATDGSGGPNLIGRYWWPSGVFSPVPIHMEGHTIALFRTRKQAREALPHVKKSFSEARVLRITVKMNSE